MSEPNQADEGAALRQMGVGIDADFSEQPEGSQPPAATPEPIAAPEVVQPPAGEAETSKTESPDTAAEKPTEEKEPSPYLKEKQRREKVLNDIESRRSEVERREKVLAEREESLKKPEEFRDERNYTARDYEQGAQLALKKAAEARELLDEDAAAQAERSAHELQSLSQRARNLEFQAACKRVGGEMVTQMPELKDTKSTLHQKVGELFEKHPMLGLHPEGMRLAPLLAKAQLEAASVPVLRSENEALKKENQRLVALTAIGGSRPALAVKAGSKDPTEADIRRMAEDFDNHRGD